MIDVEIDPCAEHESLAHAAIPAPLALSRILTVAKACPACSVTVSGTGPCEWWALCRNAATTVRPHSLLGGVPICARCDAKVARLEGEPVRTCRVCGCTDEQACEGGCAWVAWVASDLCTRCAGLGYVPGEVPDAVEG